MKDRMDVERLKDSWKEDPNWDLEETEGFEEYREELVAFRLEWEARWKEEREARLQAKAESMGIPGNTALAEYVERMENSIKQLEERVEYLEWRIKEH